MAAPAAPAWSTRRDRARAAYAIKEKPEERANEYLLGPIKSEIARSCQQARLDVPPSRGIRWTNSERLESGRNARSRIVPIVFAGIADPVAAGYVALEAGYGTLYIAALIAAAMMVFSRRDFK